MPPPPPPPPPPASDSSSDAGSDPLDLRNDEGWEDVEPDADVEDVRVKGLFDEAVVFGSVRELVEETKRVWGVDLAEVVARFGLDFYQRIKLVNYIRSQVRAGNSQPDLSSAAAFADDKYLQPVLEDDALLFLVDELGDSEEEADQDPQGDRVKQLEEELRALKANFADYREAVSRTLEERWAEKEAPNGTQAGPSTNGQKSEDKQQKGVEQGYFDSYSYNDIHETMLKDSVRTDAYRDFIYENKHLFVGKTVLDVGCGTGILSMFAAKAGAAHVIAVDNSTMIEKAILNVHANGFSDQISCLRGKIEEVTLPVDKVDIIVSEWMGYGLLFEAMFDSVVWARDRYLKSDGLMVPSHCTLRIAPFADDDYVAEHIDFWRDVYAFDMSAMMDKIRDDARVRSLVPEKLAADSSLFLELPLHTINTQELEFTKDFTVELTKDIEALDGWCIWFDTFFLSSRDAKLPADARAESWSGPGVAFTTGPGGTPTHWESVLLLVDRDGSDGALKKGQRIRGSVEYKKAGANARGLGIEMHWELEGVRDGRRGQLWKLE
ncbi:protein arginine methyltransferase RmtB [Phyllosticta citriasiana]|uniref:type I protein arginine methyltransferase n=1 Tax=Phyllosticta citriasiana TaxID=595635 RepID=A0ABR1KX18_9PEZI